MLTPSELTSALYDGDLSRGKALVAAGEDLHYLREGYDALIDAVHGHDILVAPHPRSGAWVARRDSFSARQPPRARSE